MSVTLALPRLNEHVQIVDADVVALQSYPRSHLLKPNVLVFLLQGYTYRGRGDQLECKYCNHIFTPIVGRSSIEDAISQHQLTSPTESAAKVVSQNRCLKCQVVIDKRKRLVTDGCDHIDICDTCPPSPTCLRCGKSVIERTPLFT
jgi:hypothetical protein